MFGIHDFSANLLAPRAGVGPATRSTRRRRRWRRPLAVEPLEGRALLSTFTVNSLGDTGTGSGTSGDLRYVITQVDQAPGDNTINFAVTGTITLNSALPDLSNTTGLTDIEGPGASVLTVARNTAAGTPAFGIFTVDASTQVKLVGLTMTGGSDSNGGGIANDGTLTVSDSTIADNSGGGIANTGTLTVTNSTIADNSAANGGGGIENDGTLTVTNSTIADNSGGAAGGIANDGTLTVTNSTIADNSGGAAGGIFNEYGGLTVINSTIADNRAVVLSSLGAGGGINNLLFGTMTVTNSTIADNVAVSGAQYFRSAGGILTSGTSTFGTSTLNNTIVALNSVIVNFEPVVFSPSDIGGAVTSGAYNLIGTGGSGVADPGLGALADNGGPTQTIALLPGSPAIGAGSDTIPGVTVPTTDQRGVARPSDRIDIGAFQDRGFRLKVVAGSSPQRTPVDTPFPDPLAVIVTSPYGDPVAGGVISFTVVPSSAGAGATLGADTATIAVDGQASVTATANGTRGRYKVTASATGAKKPARFSLTNLAATAGTAAVGIGTDLNWSGIQPATMTLGRATTSAPGDFTVSSSIGADSGPVTAAVGLGTSGPASPSDGRAGRAQADRSVPRAEVRLSVRGRGWSLGALTKPRMIGLASMEES